MTFANRISGLNRRKKWQIFLKELAPAPDTSVLDVGFSEEEYSPTDNLIEKVYPWPDKLTALSVDIPDQFKIRYPQGCLPIRTVFP